MGLPGTHVNLFLLAGVATAPLFMEDFRLAMITNLTQAGYTVSVSELLYPYGDWSRRLLRQLHELRHDLWTARSRPLRSIGGNRAADMIKACGDKGWPLLIGHSGGGVAAVQAASILAANAADHAEKPIRVVQIGSPKCPIPSWLHNSWMYAEAIRDNGRSSDPVTWLGNQRVWQRSSGGLPIWRQSVPAANLAQLRLPLVGGHPDYFRAGSSYLNKQGSTNLEITVQAVTNWLYST
ncbi:hypothetical protein SAMN03159341_103121 [Paenibacillus sp. 1_12]|uniref:hypothetical protein n=1 Tax=Paenibacillus sp. 1_12 TaxID=1566278 RepID=UPI0008F37EA2|nr:hypothetical protein [Paenibacillus sp. 1_12]SFL08315.1 hypothetical protein SAMN03159341_103121 [Paenibacillus sp. 1_12]